MIRVSKCSERRPPSIHRLLFIRFGGGSAARCLAEPMLSRSAPERSCRSGEIERAEGGAVERGAQRVHKRFRLLDGRVVAGILDHMQRPSVASVGGLSDIEPTPT